MVKFGVLALDIAFSPKGEYIILLKESIVLPDKEEQIFRDIWIEDNKSTL
jgi:hypothetical protein